MALIADQCDYLSAGRGSSGTLIPVNGQSLTVGSGPP